MAPPTCKAMCHSRMQSTDPAGFLSSMAMGTSRWQGVLLIRMLSIVEKVVTSLSLAPGRRVELPRVTMGLGEERGKWGSSEKGDSSSGEAKGEDSFSREASYVC